MEKFVEHFFWNLDDFDFHGRCGHDRNLKSLTESDEQRTARRTMTPAKRTP